MSDISTERYYLTPTARAAILERLYGLQDFWKRAKDEAATVEGLAGIETELHTVERNIAYYSQP